MLKVFYFFFIRTAFYTRNSQSVGINGNDNKFNSSVQTSSYTYISSNWYTL